MKKAKIFMALLAVLALLMSMAVIGTVADTTTEDTATETWDDKYSFSLSATSTEIKALDADFDVYGFKDPTAANGTAAAHGPAEPSADNALRTGDTYSYLMNGKNYGNQNQGYLKFSQMDASWYHALTYTKQRMKDFVMEYSYYPHSSIGGVVFGAEQGVFPISRDSDNTNDTGVMVYMERQGQISIGGAIDTTTLQYADGLTTSTQTSLSSTANVRVSSIVPEAGQIAVKSGTLTDTDPCYTIVVQVQDGVLTVYEKSNPTLAVSVNLTSGYTGGYVSLVTKSVNILAFKDFAFRNNEVFDDSIAVAYNSDVALLNYDFDVYRFTQTDGVFSKHTGPNNPSATDPDRTSAPKTYMTTSTGYGSYSRGYLKFVNNTSVAACTGFYALTYEKKAPADFTAAYSYYPGYNNLGMMVTSAPGVFPISEDKDNTNDTGIMIWTTAGGSVAIAGAFDATSLKTADGMEVSTHEDLCASGAAAVNHIYVSGTTGGESVGVVSGTITDGDPNYFTYNVQIVDNVLTVWEKDHADLAISVTLTDTFEGGYVSFINDDVQSGAFREFKFVTGATYEAPVVMDQTTGVITVSGVSGKELKAGSLIVTDANGVQYIPQRVNFREEGDAVEYEVIDEGFDPVGASVSYAFVQPTLEAPNIGNIGNSYNSSLNGLRFVSRFTREVVEGTEYVVTAGGNKYAISDYGMLVSSKPGLDTNTDLTAEQAMSLNAEMAPVGEYVQKLSIVEEQKFYDVCDDHIDMAVTLINIDKVTGYGAYEDIRFYARPYVVVTVDGVDTVLYGNVFNASYGDVAAVQ